MLQVRNFVRTLFVGLLAIAVLACANDPVKTRSIVALNDMPAAASQAKPSPSVSAAPPSIPSSSAVVRTSSDVDRLLIVDCLLRGATRKLGKRAIYVAPPRVVSTSQLDCEIRGGEYVAFDPSGYSERLSFWQGQAEAGDPTAQYYVGEIYEQGLGVAPDYAQAAIWYDRAANQGHRQAKRSLAGMHERGLGVARNPERALDLYLDSYGIDELEGRVVMTPTSGTELVALESQLSESKHEADRLRRDVRRLEQDLTALETKRTAPAATGGTQSAGLDQEKARIEKDRRALAKDRDRLEDDRKALTKRETALERERSKLTDQVKDLADQEQQLLERDEKASALLASVEQREKEAERRFAKSQQTEADRDELKKARSQLEDQRSDLETEKSGLAEERVKLKTAREEYAALQTKSKAQEGQLQEQEKALAELESKLASRTDEMGREDARLAGLTQKSEALESQISDLEQELSARQKKLNKAEEQVKLDIAGPTIHVIDPQLPPLASRGEDSVVAEEAERLIVGQVVAPAGLEHLTMNGEKVEIDDNLVFRPKIPVSENGTKVTLVAIDRQGKQSTRSFVVRRKLASVDAPPPPSGPNVDFGNYYALVIGNQNYAHMPDLATPHADANEISEVLENRYGFEVTTLLDADRYQLMTALSQLRKQLTSRDNLLVYYAGHGHLDEASQSGYWLPVDSEPDNPALWLATDEMTRQVGAMNAKHVLIIADSCYSGVITRNVAISIEGARTSKERLHWMSTMAKRRVRMALTAGGLVPIPDGGGGNHSIFAESLLSVLRANNEVLWGSQLHQAVAARVSYRAKSMIPYDQVPEYREMKHGDAEPGEFFFVPRLRTAGR